MLTELGENGDVQLIQGEEEVSLQDLERATEEAPVVRLVNALLTDAIKKRASDVTSSPTRRCCGCASAWTACSTRSCSRR